MLILTRRKGGRVILMLPEGQQIIVTVTEIDRGKVRLGFTAPDDIPIYREELLDRPDPHAVGKE
jgi:carbon storage regulator